MDASFPREGETSAALPPGNSDGKALAGARPKPAESRRQKLSFEEIWHATEVGILSADLCCRHLLTDQKISDALKLLIETLPNPFRRPREVHALCPSAPFAECIASHVRVSWHRLFVRRPGVERSEMVTVLRSILSSIDVWTTPGPSSRAYLEYLEEFLHSPGLPRIEIEVRTKK